MRRALTCIYLAACCFAIPNAAQSRQIHDGQSLVAAMHDRYANSWYDNVIFKENAITLNPDGSTKDTEVWDEALVMPGKLRIDRGQHSAGNGFVFSDGSLTRFKDGQPSGPTPFVHLLLVLGFDVYKQPVETTVSILKAKGIDLSKVHEEQWQGESVYVVGAAQGDLKSKQFWVEKSRLLFVRLIEPNEDNATQISDTRFRGYQKLAGGWISARVEFYVGGKNTFNEDYFDIQSNVKLDPALFDPKKYRDTTFSNLFPK